MRESDHYTNEYVKSFVEKWDELIDWEGRARSEGGFFIERLREQGARDVLDVATGTGFHSVRLLNEGFDVVSVDGSAEMLAKAFENGSKHGHILRTVLADWRWLSRDVPGKFDAVICLGNSFTHLFSERDRRKVLAEFYAMLRHDGILILDQRNYDAILNGGYSSSHTYYYCGEDIAVEPEHVDDGLARFRYQFPGDEVYHLNMFPLRKEYLRRLMYEVGFQRIETYGDFQETYAEGEPDFFIHVAEKQYEAGIDEMSEDHHEEYSGAVNVARDYYNSDDADNFYFTIWGGEDIHVGVYEREDEPVFDASRRTVERMASMLDNIGENSRVLDVGSGFGGAARYLAGRFGCRVVALNLSEVENERARAMNREQGIEQLIEVVDGSFEDVPFTDGSFDVVWSQDAILHSGERSKVVEEISRVLKPGGELVFTDPMKADDCPDDDEILQPILDRLHLDTLASPGFYRAEAKSLGLEEITFEEHHEQLPRHYARILEETEANEDKLARAVSREYIDRMKKGLGHWVEGGNSGHLAWGIFHFRASA